MKYEYYAGLIAIILVVILLLLIPELFIYNKPISGVTTDVIGNGFWYGIILSVTWFLVLIYLVYISFFKYDKEVS